jgi:CTP:molybdopterin cytidylyltransferase MocA
METLLKTRILAGFAFAQVEAHETSKRFGYWDKQRNIPETFAQIHLDASKALETIIVGNGPSDKLKDVSRAEEKLADVIIRILDVSQGLGMHVSVAVIAKLEYNEELSKAVKKDF